MTAAASITCRFPLLSPPRGIGISLVYHDPSMMKKTLAALLVLAVVAGSALFWLSRNLDGLVKGAIENYGSAMTQAKVTVGSVKISSADGKGSISHLTIGNPSGFQTPHALQVAQVEVEVDLASLAKDVVVIHRIDIEAPDVIYEKGDALTNFDTVIKNIGSAVGSDQNQSQGEPKKVGKKLIVELFTLRDAKAQASAAFMQGKAVAVAMPDITIKDIGRAKGGVTPGELGQEIAGALKAKLTGASSIELLKKSSSQTLDLLGPAVKGLFK